MKPWQSALLALLGGSVWGFCHATEPRPWLAAVALVPLLWLAEEKRGWMPAFLFGLAAWFVSIPWIAHTVSVYGELPTALGWGALLLLSLWLSAYVAVFAAVARPFLNHQRWAILAVPSLWVLLEVLRGTLLSGFPWNQAGHAWIEVPGALQVSARFGTWGVSFLLVAINVATWSALRERSLRPWLPTAAAVALVLGAHALWPTETEAGAPIEVRVLQPNTPILRNPRAPEVQQAYLDLFSQSRPVCEGSALVLWPESASWPYAVERDGRFARDLGRLADQGCGILLNSPRWDDGKVFNSAYLVAGTDRIQSTDKRHLVPFGEYIPFSKWLPFADTLARNIGDFSANQSPNLLDWQGTRIGVSICYEVIFAREVAELTDRGAGVLATITNDAWYGDSSAPHQHLRAARFRAAENGRPLLRAALTGISAVIDDQGRVQQQIGVGVPGLLNARITPRLSRTPFTRWPWTTPIAAAAILASAIFALRRERSQRP